MKGNFIIAVVSIFILLTAMFFGLKIYAPAYQFYALMTGNLVMCIVTLCSYLIINKQLHERPAAFVRGVSGASFLKLMICMIGILVYVLLNRQDIHKPSVFILLGIYAIYTTFETISLSKLAREEKKS